MTSHVITPLINSVFLSKKSDFNVFLKLENSQPSGSFKDRGIGYLIRQKLQECGKDIEVFSSSGGNAGLAAANASRMLGIPCTVCVPEKTSQNTRARLELFGARVVAQGSVWLEADKYLRETLMKQSKARTAVYCHPFDDELIWEGHSSIVSEIKEQLPSTIVKPDAVILSVGGGGLYCGVMKGLINEDWANSVPIVAVEPEGAPCFYNSIKSRKIVNYPPNTRISSLASSYVSEQALTYALNDNRTKSILVTDEQAIQAARSFLDDHKFMVEPACGAALVPLYHPDMLKRVLPNLEPGSNIVVIVCGGSSTSLTDYLQ